MNILNLRILILDMLFSNHFYVLPNALNTKNVFLFFNVITHESIEFIIIAFQNTSKNFESKITKLF